MNCRQTLNREEILIAGITCDLPLSAITGLKTMDPGGEVRYGFNILLTDYDSVCRSRKIDRYSTVPIYWRSVLSKFYARKEVSPI